MMDNGNMYIPCDGNKSSNNELARMSAGLGLFCFHDDTISITTCRAGFDKLRDI
jgi:hypothetical protein